MLDTSFLKLLLKEHQQLFEEFFVREPSTKELELKKTEPRERVGKTEAHHYKHYSSISAQRRGEGESPVSFHDGPGEGEIYNPRPRSPIENFSR